MSYVIQAIILGPRAAAPGTFEGLSVVSLPQGLIMAPLADGARQRLGLSFCPLTDEGEDPRLPESVVDLLRSLSRDGRAAYIEAEIFGGAGLQACLLADAGEIVDTIYVDVHAINAALAFLGVTAEGGQDEFDAVGLGRHRWTEEWMEGGLTMR